MTARKPIGREPAMCSNGHPRESMRAIIAKDGRQMSLCVDCRKEARAVAKMPDRAIPPMDRLLARISVRPDGCWIANLPDNGHGYKYLSSRGRKIYAHRLIYEFYFGAIPDGYAVDHLCSNRACCCPAHLEAVTQAENSRRAGLRKTHCANGHPRTEANIYVRKDNGGKQCSACQRQRSIAKRERQSAEAR